MGGWIGGEAMEQGGGGTAFATGSRRVGPEGWVASEEKVLAEL
jgi:hypothetical protein